MCHHTCIVPHNELMSNDLRRKVSMRMKELRQSEGLSQRQLALLCGIHYNHIQKIELCSINFGIDTLEKIIEGFDMTVEEFFQADTQ